MLKNFFWKNKLAIVVCVLTIAFGIGWWALSNPGTTTIGENITVGSNLYVTGNVGIGTVSPDTLLHLYNSGGNQLKLGNSNAVNYEWTLNATGGGHLGFINEWAGSPATRLFIENNGNVGIGTTSPSQKLDVSGQIHATGDICTDAGGGKCLSTGGGVGEGENYTLVYQDDFQSDASGWSYTTRSTFAGATILGGYNLTSKTSFYKDYNLTGIPHTEVMVRFTYYAIDTWDWHWAWVQVGNGGLWNKQIAYSDPGRIDIGGWSCVSACLDGIYFGEARVSHTGNTLRVRVGSTLDQDPNDESFGVDNVEVWVR